METHNVAVWLDHREAKLFRVDGPTFEQPVSVRAHHSHIKKHEVTTAEHKHPADAEHYYHAVVSQLREATAVLVMGPSSAKLELIKHVHRHDPAFATKLVGVETVDHPTDKQIAAFARHYFEKREQAATS